MLRDTVRKWGAKGGSAVVLDPRTGAVLAMAVAPGFDANKFGSTPASKRRNRVVTDAYEPGSTFKVVTVAAALSEKIVTPDRPRSRCRRRSASPTGSSTSTSRARPSG